MVPQLLMVSYSDGDSQILWKDSERIFRRSCRLDEDGKQRAVLLVLPAADQPSRSILDRLTHEYELKDELDGAWAVRPLDLVRDAGRTMLVLEDDRGEPVDRLLGVAMEVGRFLRLAIGVALALGRLHQRGLVHKDIKPANIRDRRAAVDRIWHRVAVRARTLFSEDLPICRRWNPFISARLRFAA
jgi:serine/threonine protein kinase